MRSNARVLPAQCIDVGQASLDIALAREIIRSLGLPGTLNTESSYLEVSLTPDRVNVVSCGDV